MRTTHIQRHLHAEYSRLYARVVTVDNFDNTFFNDLPQVGDGVISGEPLSVEEMEAALLDMKGGKSPGLDGLGIEFYKLHFHKFGRWFTSMYNNCVQSGVVPKSWETAVLKLIPKGEGIPSFKLLRPISLICDDKKIGARGIAKRISCSTKYY